MQAVIPMTDDTIRAQAALLFRNLANYQGLKTPAFSRSWLQGFRRRQNLGIGAGQQSPAPTQDSHSKDLSPILAWQWPLANIFNCDEASLLWKSMPYANDFAEQSFTEAMNRLRLTALLCSNATGGERLPIWFVGNEEELESIDGGYLHIQGFAADCKWKHEKSASMTSAIFAEWLMWFDEQTYGREILLLVASRDAHVSGFQAVSSGARPLKHITVAWLSFDEHTSTSTLPKELDLVEIFKLYYAKRWLSSTLSHIEARRDPLLSMDVLQAVRWSIEVWALIQPSSIQNCFYTSRMRDRLHLLDRSKLLLQSSAI